MTTDIDLTEAVERAARALWPYKAVWEDVDEAERKVYRARAHAALTAALSHIERQVREQVAREIEDYADKKIDDYSMRWISGGAAARIARGEQP